MTQPLLVEVSDQAHRRSVEAVLSDVVRTLVEALGRTLVAYIANVDPKTVDRWAEGGNARSEAEARVRTTYQVFQLLNDRENENTVRAWFIGLNPQLEHVSPAEALREGNLRDVLVAAKSFTLGG